MYITHTHIHSKITVVRVPAPLPSSFVVPYAATLTLMELLHVYSVMWYM